MNLAITKSEIESKLIEQIELVTIPLGFRVVDLDFRVGGVSVARVFLDRVSAAPTPVKGYFPPTIGECAMMSPVIGKVIDESEWGKGAYELEVSSPGLDRRLRLSTDFDQQVGKDVKLKLWERAQNGGANISGLLERSEGGTLFVRVGRESLPIALSVVKQANVVWKPGVEVAS